MRESKTHTPNQYRKSYTFLLKNYHHEQRQFFLKVKGHHSKSVESICLNKIT